MLMLSGMKTSKLHEQLDVQFAYMPYSKISHPALGASILKSCLKKNRISCNISYLNLNFAELVGTSNYLNLLLSTTTSLMGEWTFARAAFGDQFNDIEEKYGKYPYLTEKLEKIALIAERWIEEMADEIAKDPPRILICSSMFQQNTASLAILKAIKRRCPTVKTIMGGPNTEGVLGLGLLRRAPWLDYICAGEGEETLPSLCRSLIEKKEPLAKPIGVMGQDDLKKYDGLYQINVQRPSLDKMEKSPIPNFDDYFEAIKQSKLKITPGLLLESSRGCWWGQRSQCTFCGLNGDGMAYRAQQPQNMINIVKAVITKHKIKKVEFVDNIIAKNYFEEFLPQLNKEKMSIFYETKADFSESDAKRFHESGVRWIQPGIESLLDPVLAIMKKGTSAALNVECLRLCREYGLKPAWSILCGFPEEKEEWYEETAKVMPSLFHLQPPNAIISMRFDRFSPHHDTPEKWGLDLVPYDTYKMIYPSYEGQYADIAYFFKRKNISDQKSSPYIHGQHYDKCFKIIKEWREHWKNQQSSSGQQPELTLHLGTYMSILDTRNPMNQPKKTIINEAMLTLLRYCRSRRRVNSILAYTENNPDKFSNYDSIMEILEEATSNKWIIQLGKNFISVVQEKNHQHADKRGWPGGYLDKHCQPSHEALKEKSEATK